jgi:uncharacterized protein YdaU (DUF1376 family)
VNYYPFHIGDYAAHTGHLDPLEDVAYRRAIDAYMLSEGPLPADPADVARRIRMRDHVAIVRSVLQEFFTKTPEGWRHARCDAEIAKVQSKSDKARTSAAKRWHSERDANAMRTHSERSADAVRPEFEGNAPKTQDPIPKEEQEKESARTRAPAARGSRIPEGFPGEDEIAWCRTERPELDAPRVAQVFRDHALANGRTLRDWRAGWRTWVGKERAPFRTSPAAARDAETAEFLGRLTGGLAGTRPNREVVDVEPANVRRIA